MPIDFNHNFKCTQCDYSCSNESNFNKHTETKKHQRRLHNVAHTISYNCSTCDYSCSKLFNYNKHLETNRHKSRLLLESKIPNCSEESPGEEITPLKI